MSYDVELVQVSKVFPGPVKAVDQLDLKIRKGEFLSFLGPSGCGKTTTLRMIAGFEYPTEGRVILKGADVTLTPPHRRNTAMVFQNYALFPHKTVFENVAFGLHMRRVGRKEIQERVGRALEMVDIASLANRYPRQLSGGQQQRVALARALVTEPSVLLLDEPLSALDKKLREQMRTEIKRIQKELSVTTIFVTHDQEEALTLSDRIVIMAEGKALQIGTPTELYDRPANAFVAEFLGTANLLEGAVETLDENAAHAVVASPEGLRFRVTAGHPAPLRRGQTVRVSVRPEKLSLQRLDQPPPQEGCNRLEGEVEQTFFHGAFTRYLVKVGNRTVVVDVPGSATAAGFQRGDRVQLFWAVTDGVVVDAA